LQEIHKNQAEDSRKNNQAILSEIGQDELERFHLSTINQFAIKSIREDAFDPYPCRCKSCFL
jgi:hypothetical protein